jgi:selenocysteine lyase/cysteine desulfurase
MGHFLQLTDITPLWSGLRKSAKSRHRPDNRESTMTLASPFTTAESTAIRRNFPILAEYTFLSSAAMAPMPVPTREAITTLASDLSAFAYRGWPTWGKTIEETRGRAADLIGADPSEIAFIKNTSDGVSLVAQGLGLQPGDEVIINDCEFPSNVYPWLALGKKGIRVITVKSVDGRVTPDLIAAAVTDRTKVIAISTVQFSTGFRADLASLATIAHKSGGYLFVDAIQSLGVIPTDVKSLGIDFLASGGHKWLCAAEGIGIFYCTKEHLDLIEPTRFGWHSVVGDRAFDTIDFQLKQNAQRFEEGTPNLIGIVALNASLKLLMAQGIDRNFSQVMSLTDHLIAGVKDRGGSVLSPVANLGERSGIVIVTTGDQERDAALMKTCEQENIMVMPRGGGIRVAPHFFNTTADIDQFLACMGK